MGFSLLPALKRGIKISTNRHFWVVVILFVVMVVLHYPQQLLGVSSPSLFSFIGLSRHAVERFLLLFPICYCGYIFEIKWGLVCLLVGSIIMIPRVFWVSDYFSDALLETIVIIAASVLVNLWIHGYKKDKEQRQHILTELDKTHRQLQIYTANLEISERRYRELFENAQDAVWEHDLEGNITSANYAVELLSGYNQNELIGMNVKVLLTEDSLKLAGSIRYNLFAGEQFEQPYEQYLLRKDGTIAALQLTTNLIMENEQPKGFLHIARDITKEKTIQDTLNKAYQELRESNQQLKESQGQLLQAEKLTSLGQMAASVAHEVNNPLSGILVYTQLLIKKLAADDIPKQTALEYLSKMESETVRATKIILNLLDFARQSPPAFRNIDINEVITKSFDLAAHTANLQNIQVTKELDSNLPRITADFDQLQQVCTNLILNAIQAMPKGGKLIIRTSVDGTQIKIEVKDTGHGISPENMRRLFTPFFTTKREVKGVGLGLAVAYGIVQRHKGKIEVQSQRSEGTTFTVILPISSDEIY